MTPESCDMLRVQAGLDWQLRNPAKPPGRLTGGRGASRRIGKSYSGPETCFTGDRFELALWLRGLDMSQR
jgi:hypothetical protein